MLNMPLFDNQEIALNYATFGDSCNPALIFSNSLGTSYHMWQPQIDACKTIILSFAMTLVAMVILLHQEVLIVSISLDKTSLICLII